MNKPQPKSPKFTIGEKVIHTCRHTGRDTEGTVSSMNWDHVAKTWRYNIGGREAPESYFRKAP